MAHIRGPFVEPLIKPNEAIKGSRITSIAQVLKLATQGKCVVYRGGRNPAAFIQNFQARHLQNEIDIGVITYYIPKPKK